MNKKVIVFAPHPDDETFGCGGTIAKKLSEGYEVFIVVLTDGRNAFLKLLGIDSDPTPHELKEIRKEEVKNAARVLGLPKENLLFLDFEDGTLEKNEDEAQERVIELLRENPPPIEVYFPYERDYHEDHRVTNRIVRDAINKMGLRTMRCQYSIVQKYGRVGPLIDVFFDLFRHNMIRVDISKFLPIKKAALKEFKSEVTIMSQRQQRPVMENIQNYLKNEEIFYISK